MEEKYTLNELNEFIRQIFALNFSDSVWVSCEIAQINQSRGHFWIDLVEKDEKKEEISAKSTAVLWRKDYLRLQEELGTAIDSLLQGGMQVLLKVRVDFHEVYGMKFIIDEIDPTYTLGKLEITRQKTILKLKEKNLLERNKELKLPVVLQRIAILSSETAAGYQDFLAQLKNNVYDYKFEYQLFTTAVQGMYVEKEMRSRLASIRRRRLDYDCVVILRGGGARLDLAAFDGYNLCEDLANFPLPILTGIGHDVDETVADMVANTALKTPTAAAEFIINRNVQFERIIEQMGAFVQHQTIKNIKKNSLHLERIQQILNYSSKQIIQSKEVELNQIEKDIPIQSKFRLFASGQQLNSLEKMITLLSPEAAYKRGFSLTTKNSQVIISVKELKKGDIINSHFKDGDVESLV